MTRNVLGVNASVPTTVQMVALNTEMGGADNGAYLYVQASGAIAATDVVLIDEAGQAAAVTTTNSAGALGDRIGVANAAFADNEYGWVQIGGTTTVNVATSAAANTKLNTTATAGRIDDDATTGAETIHGLYTTAAEASNAAAVILHRPFIDATL